MVGGNLKHNLFSLLPNTNKFTLRILNMNVSGLGFKTDKLKVRMAELKTLLQNSDYDIVLIQEAWYKREYYAHFLHFYIVYLDKEHRE